MRRKPVIAVVGTYDSKAEEHLFLRDCIEQRGFGTLTINVGTQRPSPAPLSLDLYELMSKRGDLHYESRDETIRAMIREAGKRIKQLYENGAINGIISAGGGTGTHLCTRIMHELPLGVPKVMVSTVASRDMSKTVGTKDITMVHSVVDLLGVNSISGVILDEAAAGICGMVQSRWRPSQEKNRIALPSFGFIAGLRQPARRWRLWDMR